MDSADLTILEPSLSVYIKKNTVKFTACVPAWNNLMQLLRNLHEALALSQRTTNRGSKILMNAFIASHKGWALLNKKRF